VKKLVDAGGSLSCDSFTGTASPTSSPSAKVRAGGQGVYRGPLGFSVTGAVQGGCTQSGPYSGSISPTAQKVKPDAQACVLDGDQVSVSIPGVLGGGGGCTITGTVTAHAGQAKVKGN